MHVDNDLPIRFDRIIEGIDHENEDDVEENEILFKKKSISKSFIQNLIYLMRMVRPNVCVLMMSNKMIHEVVKYEQKQLNPNDAKD